MKTVFSNDHSDDKKEITQLVKNFNSEGEIISQERNTIKIFQTGEKKLNIKSFRKPNFINKIAYNFFRKSKAKRSFEHALSLLEKGIGTPQPVAYFQESSGLFFGKSYYVSEQLDYDLTYRDIIHDTTFPNRNEILKQFTDFTHNLHENGILFLDHSPGNTLIKVGEKGYEFYLVDLNRMKFRKKINYKTRIKNFSKLTSDKLMVATMSGEYAKITGADYHSIFNDMWENTSKFQHKYHRKRRLKKKLKI